MYQKAGHATAITVIPCTRGAKRRSRGKANEEKCFALRVPQNELTIVSGNLEDPC